MYVQSRPHLLEMTQYILPLIHRIDLIERCCKCAMIVLGEEGYSGSENEGNAGRGRRCRAR